MTDDVKREIQDILNGGTKRDRQGKPGNIEIIGNSGTVVIGDGNRDIGRRESDRPEGERDETRCHGRRESDHAIRDELSQLRGQVKDLVQLINTQFLNDDSEDLKDDLRDDSDSLSSSVVETPNQSDVSFCSHLVLHPSLRSKRRAASRPVPDCPIQSHFIPDVSYLMAAHTERTHA